MKRANNILISLRLANSFLSTHLPNTTRTPLFQVTQFSQLSSPFPIHSHRSHPFNTHQKLFFSSSPNSAVELIVANDWSTELETELNQSSPEWSHEKVIYILKRITKYPQKAFAFFNWVREKDGFRPSSSVHSLVLRILFLDDMGSLWKAMRSMKAQGFVLDEETYNVMLVEFRKKKMVKESAALSNFYKRMVDENGVGNVKEVLGVVSEHVWDDQVEKQLDGLIQGLSDEFVTRVLKGLQYRPSNALRFFDWVGRHRGFEHNTVTYNALARVLFQGHSVKEFWSLIEEMKSKGFDLDLDSYAKILRHLQKNKMMEEAVKLYEFMMDSPYKPSNQDCVLLLRRLSDNDIPDKRLAFRIAKKYESMGFTLSKAAYDGIHRCLTSIGEFDEAEKIVDIMKNASYEPDNITYSQLVFGLCKAKRFDEACKVLENMEAVGCIPDIRTWTILIQGQCEAGEVDKAMVCFSNMLRTDCEVDADLLAVLVKGFLSQGKVVGAYNLLIEMVDNIQLRPWQATYKSLIEKLAEFKKLEEGMKVLRLMKKQDYPPYPDPLVGYISKFGTVDDAAELLKALSGKDHPSPAAYLNVFKAFFEAGRHLEANNLLFKCPHLIRKHVKICKLFGSEEGTTN